MARSTVITLSQSLELNDITDVAVTAIAHNDDTGKYSRNIVFFGTAGEEGGLVPTTLLVTIIADTAEALKVTVPENEF